MIRIDDTLLEEIGLISLPKAERDQMLRQIYETLEMRVGMRLAERMTDQQLDEFERFIDTNDEAGALKWLETNFPDYKQVVADELEKLKTEIKKDSATILQTMQGQTQIPEGAPVQQTYPQPVPTAAQPQFSSAPQAPSAHTPQYPAANNPAQPVVVPSTYNQPIQHSTQPVQSVSGEPIAQQPLQPDPSAQTAQVDDQTDDMSPTGSIPPPPAF